MSSTSGEGSFEAEQEVSAFDAYSGEELEFAIEAACLLADAQVIDDLQTYPVVFDAGAGRISIVGGALDEDLESLTLLNLVVGEPNARLTLAQVRAAADQSVRLYRQAGRVAQLSSIPSELQELARQIEAAQDHISWIRLVLVTRGVAPAKSLDDYVIEGTNVRIDVFDTIRLNRAAGSAISREDIEVNFEDLIGCPISCSAVRQSEHAEFDTYLAAIPGNALSAMYAEYSTRLLELNVRAFLGVRGKKTANAGLRETLLNAPSHFLAYNNGIAPSNRGIKHLGCSLRTICSLAKIYPAYRFCRTFHDSLWLDAGASVSLPTKYWYAQ